MYDVMMTPFLCFMSEKAWKLKTLWWRQIANLFVFKLSGPNVVSIPNFSSISLQLADFSLFFGAKSYEVPSLIFLPWQQLKI